MTDMNTASSYIDSYMPPQNDPVSQDPQGGQADGGATMGDSNSMGDVSQLLEDQNIFHLLGVQDASYEEKESFLDELQQVIWESFLEDDVELLLTEEEMAEFKKIADKTGVDEEEKQVEMIEYLEKLIPDLEKIMLEKALDLKREMVEERIHQLKDLYKENLDLLQRVVKAEDLVKQEQWRAAADELNSIAE